jgi:hypothetical protein
MSNPVLLLLPVFQTFVHTQQQHKEKQQRSNQWRYLGWCLYYIMAVMSVSAPLLVPVFYLEISRINCGCFIKSEGRFQAPNFDNCFSESCNDPSISLLNKRTRWWVLHDCRFKALTKRYPGKRSIPWDRIHPSMARIVYCWRLRWSSRLRSRLLRVFASRYRQSDWEVE